ncbi:hypothetical protein Zmor_019879 [Zophobas morio]|uniref:NADH dehydrogenase [ubiquinone] 1 beta subcomplex subunit 8, mitochondrial n=1 Tax=Zophobas morio TaxID=2755281 RepID=A0AA38I0M5_9CUCU|nr:hypothetical protein Zmor_019879 [Zophobas morio]
MSFLIKSAPFRHFPLHPLVLAPKRTHWNKDYKPGPYPYSLEEKRLAAEKYNLHPAEYRAYPDDGFGRGDYPKLPDLGYESRDHHYPWDNPEHLRNFGEPLHAEFGLVRQDRLNVGVKMRYPLWLQVLQFFGAMLASAGLFWFFEKFKAFHPVIPTQCPEEGVTHYTFEPEEEGKPGKSK